MPSGFLPSLLFVVSRPISFFIRIWSVIAAAIDPNVENRRTKAKLSLRHLETEFDYWVSCFLSQGILLTAEDARFLRALNFDLKAVSQDMEQVSVAIAIVRFDEASGILNHVESVLHQRRCELVQLEDKWHALIGQVIPDKTEQ